MADGIEPARDETRVLIACSGVGHVARGYENVSLELASLLQDAAAAVTLARGGGGSVGVRLPCFQRSGTMATLLRLDDERAYRVEQCSFAPFLYALARLGGYDVVHLHDPALMNALWHARRLLGGRFAILFTNGGWLSPEHLHRPDLIQTLTPVDLQRLQDAAFPDRQVAMVPYGVRPAAAPSRTWTGAPKRLLGVGTLNDTSKGFATAIRAAAQIGDVTLRLLGQRDAETPAIEALGASMLGDRFSATTVARDEVPAELNRADVFVLPTHSEGFCMAVLEAMAAGVPCVVSDIPVLRWLVGDAGVCVPPDRPDLWAQAIRGLDADTRQDLSKAGRERAAAFHWSRLGADYLAMYRKAVAARRRSMARA